ncbi:MAG: serine acetyltransferase [Candidatus Eremiobacteraeota bacterium]|nr:serine acetyltransferase [Candidatus Eremiobacteraeota bacterium]
MRTSLATGDLARYLKAQLESAFPDGRKPGVKAVVGHALERVERSFSKIVLAGYSKEGEATFSHLQGDQYAAFLYFAANTAWREAEDVELASKLFLLNKALNGIVVMYDTILPEVFVLMHTVGTVLGKANYGNYFVAAQNVTVGMDRDAIPTFDERVVLYGGSTVIGGCRIGNRVTVASNATVRGETIADGSIVAGSSPELVVKPATRDVSALYFT